MLVRAKEKHYYGGRDRLPGEEFEMDDREAVDINILTVLGKVEIVAMSKQSAPPQYQIAAPKLEPEEKQDMGEGEEFDQRPHRRRHYRRRDMRAEE